ncbi:exocyst complex component 1-like [Saccostrea cucullata]|uniref:exocyst complex component 1-like n=1 Tax=Saccostrea cuccullata TaxID=36930 RepID=UPI002ECFB30C
MTAIKHTLNRDVFLPNDERLIGFVHVTKVGRKKKTSFLCAALSTETPVQARVYQVKKADKTEAYKKKVTWLLRELKVVDGKSSSKETAEFDLHFEKVYKWVASSVNDKETFIACLWKLSQRYLIQKPDFLNVPRHLLEEVSRPTGSVQTTQQEDDIVTMEDDYQALTPKEESDLDQLMSECKIAISNAELFAEQLSKQLSVLDGANIHSIMGSEDQVLNLMRLLDDGITSAEKIEDKLEFYDSILQNVKDQMEVMKEKDALIRTRNKNHQQLEELDSLVKQLDLDTKYLKALQDGDLNTPGGIYECTTAAHALQKCLNVDIHPALNQMSALEEQQRKFSRFSDKFGKRLAHHLNNLFIHQGNEHGETLSRQAPDFKLPQHNSAHRDLTPYADLMMWLKNSDFDSFTQLSKVYTQSLSKLYNKEIQDFLEMAKQKLGSKPDKNRLGVGLTSQARALSGSSSSLNRKMSGSVQSLNSDNTSFHGSSHDLAMRHLFDQVIDKILSELEPVCLSEQDFCVRFFHLAGDTPTVKEPKQEEESEDIWKPIQPAAAPVEEFYEENLGGGLKIQRRRTKSKLRHMNEEVRRMMGELFPNLESELEAFVSYADRLDGFNSMYMLVRMSQHVNNAQDAGSFLSVMYASCLVKIKRNFDKFISNQIKTIQDFKVSKKSRCGIIAFVHNFEDFKNVNVLTFRNTQNLEAIFKSYKTLELAVIYEQIARVANESQKTPHLLPYLFVATLSSLKIPCLESDRKEAKQIYQDNLNSYTLNLLGRPLEKLHVFFEGVQNRVATGVKPEEVGFQLAFSKQELRKVIKEYPVKEVKKGLDGIYKKTHKDLCEEENLLQVVWFSMQDEFIKQIKHYEDLINQCYPDSGITLEFKVDDVLSFFSEIAQSR